MNKFLGILSAIGFALAYVFYFLFNKAEQERLVANRENVLDKAEEKADAEAIKEHNAIKANNIDIANDITRIIKK